MSDPSRPTDRTEIVAQTCTPASLADRLKGGAEARRRNKAEREASRQVLRDGSVIYRDSPPGVGWVLIVKTGKTDRRGRPTVLPNKYLRTRDEAIAHWMKLTGHVLTPKHT